MTLRDSRVRCIFTRAARYSLLLLLRVVVLLGVPEYFFCACKAVAAVLPSAARIYGSADILKYIQEGFARGRVRAAAADKANVRRQRKIICPKAVYDAKGCSRCQGLLIPGQLNVGLF